MLWLQAGAAMMSVKVFGSMRYASTFFRLANLKYVEPNGDDEMRMSFLLSFISSSYVFFSEQLLFSLDILSGNRLN